MITIPRRRRSRGGLDLTPLIDVVFQLLVFFLLTATFSVPAIPLDLPDAEASDASDVERAVVISIDADGALWLGQTRVSYPELEATVREMKRADPDRRVAVRGDGTLPYDRVIRVLDACRRAGARDVALITEPPE